MKELIERLAEEIGLHPSQLVAWLKHARWSSKRLKAEAEKPGWRERLQSDAIEAELDNRVSDVGPRGFASLTDEQILAKVTPRLRTWVSAYNGRSAVLLGPTGCGKSIAAYCVLRRLKREAARARLQRERWCPSGFQDDTWANESRFRDGWISAQDLLTVQRSHRLGDSEPQEIRRAKTDRLMVIDDISWPSRHDLTREVLFARYDAGLATIVTAGVPMSELSGGSMFGDAFARRCLDARGEPGDLVDEFGGK